MPPHAAEIRALPPARPEQLAEYLSVQRALTTRQREMARVMRALGSAQQELLRERWAQAQLLCRQSAELAVQSRRILQYQDDLRRFLVRRRLAQRATDHTSGPEPEA